MVTLTGSLAAPEGEPPEACCEGEDDPPPCWPEPEPPDPPLQALTSNTARDSVNIPDSHLNVLRMDHYPFCRNFES